MKRIDRIKLRFTRNWRLPGQERLSKLLKPSGALNTVIKNGITWLSNEDIAIYTTADNYIEWSILSAGTYEDEINKLIRISLNAGGCALDIGGNIGLQSIRMSQCVGDTGRVYAFEPLEHLQQKFKKNMALNKAENVTLFPYALSDVGSEADFMIDTNSWNQGTFSIDNSSRGAQSQHVMIKVGDEIEEIKNLTRLDLIKIDVEGFEYAVLRGLTNSISKHKPRIIFEYDSNYWLNNSQNIIECFAFLRSLNYMLYQITPVGCEYIKNVNDAESGNIFCITADEK